MAVSTRTRFEIFKRDSFTCRYCGRKSPEVILEVDHITPLCEGGGDDPINLATSCWECNRGKAGVSLSERMTGEDPHDKAILILEQERQLAEYNEVVRQQRERRESDIQDLIDHWCLLIHKDHLKYNDANFVRWVVHACPVEIVKDFMDYASSRGKTKGLAYVAGCVKNWRASNDPNYEGFEG